MNVETTTGPVIADMNNFTTVAKSTPLLAAMLKATCPPVKGQLLPKFNSLLMQIIHYDITDQDCFIVVDKILIN